MQSEYRNSWHHLTDEELTRWLALYRLRRANFATEMDPEVRRKMIHEEQDYLYKAFPVTYLLRMGVIAGVSKKHDRWKLRADAKYYFFENTKIEP